KPDLTGVIVAWSIELSKFDLRFEPCGSVHGQHLADFATELSLAKDDPPQPWLLYVDDLSDKKGGEVGVFLEGPHNLLI
ncbi:hypothetical protein VIGAN_02131400, partial [Vigna angularis var. angularis]